MTSPSAVQTINLPSEDQVWQVYLSPILGFYLLLTCECSSMNFLSFVLKLKNL
mgnify:CR=1 FL=1